MTDQQEWDPFTSNDPHIKFLIASIVTAAIVLVEDPTRQDTMLTMLHAASALKDAVDMRREQWSE